MTIDVELIDQICEQIALRPETFDMKEYNSDCGTVACIAGWGALLKYGKYVESNGFRDDSEITTYEEDQEILRNLGGVMALYYKEDWPRYYRDLADNESEAKAAISLLRDIQVGIDVWGEEE